LLARRLTAFLIAVLAASGLATGAAERPAKAVATLAKAKAERAYLRELKRRYGYNEYQAHKARYASCRRLTSRRYRCTAQWGPVYGGDEIESGLYANRGTVRQYSSGALDVTMSRPECVSACFWSR
jgi:hypothetical protein